MWRAVKSGSAKKPQQLMCRSQAQTLSPVLGWKAFLVLCLLLLPLPVLSQDSGSEGVVLRGDKAEISITVRDSSGEPISAPASVKLFHDGLPLDQGSTSHGRAFFVPRALGAFTIVVEATGYKAAQKDVSIPVAVKAEVDIYLQRQLAANESVGVPGKPVLAPKAKEAFDKALQALNANKLDQAEKYVAEALRLAPGHPDVLFLQGVLFLNRSKWGDAQAALEKSTQLDPENARAFSALGMALANQGKYEQAIPPLEKSQQLAPMGWETQWTLAKAYYHHEQYPEALQASQQALASSSGKAPQIELLVAQSLTAVGRYEDSAKTLRDFLKNHGDRPEAATARRWLENLATSGKIQR
jgi:Tfp pilus assembly protein PilF